MILGGALAAVVALPVGRLVAAASAGTVPWQEVLAAERVLEPMRNSLLVTLAVTAVAAVVGVGAALVTERMAVRGRDALRLGMAVPLFIPDFVAALSWSAAYERGGLVDDLIGLSAPWVTGPIGVVVVLASGAIPLVYLVVAAALATRAEPELELAARACGADRWTAWRTVTLPLALPAVAAGAALVMVTTMNAFAIPAVLGRPAGFPTMTTRIFEDLSRSSEPAAFDRVLVMAVTLAVATLALAVLAEILLPSLGRRRRASGSFAAHARPSWLPAIPLVAFLALSVVIPAAALVLTSVVRGVGLAPVPANWTLDHYAEALGARFGPALANSVLLAVAAATAVVLLGLIGLVVARGRGRRSLGAFSTIGFAVPGTALAVGVLLAYGASLRDTLLLIGVAYVAKFWAIGQRTLAASADLTGGEPMQAARASGAGAFAAARTVAIPLLRPTIVAAWLLVALFALHEVTMSILLYGPGSQTLAVVILNLQQLGDPTVTAALAVLLTTGSLLLALPVVRRPRRASVLSAR